MRVPFLRSKVIPEVILHAVKAHDSLGSRKDGYAEALADLSKGLKGCNSFALLAVEPAVTQMQSKLLRMP